MYNTENIYNLLFEKLEAVVDIAEIQKESFKQNTEIKTLKKGEYYIREGEVPKHIPYLLKGLMRKFVIDGNARDYTKFFSKEYEFSGSFTAFLQQNESSFFVEALEDCLFVDIPYEYFRFAIQNYKCWMYLYIKSLERFYILKEKREEQFMLEDGKSLYRNFIKDFPELENRLKQYHIASYLGITPASLSRIRSELAKAVC